MGWGWLLILALIQGLTEFLPVSSSGHLALARAVIGDPDLGKDVTVEVALHLGTLGAVIVFFRQELWGLARGLLRPGAVPGPLAGRERPVLGYLFLGTLPAGVAGLTAKDRLENVFSRPDLVGVFLMITAAGLLATRWMAERRRGEAEMGVGRSLLVGLAQALALLPGISRSGATIVAGLACGAGREAAFRFSFLLSVPAILGAAMLQGRDVVSGEAPLTGGALPLTVAMLVSGIVGYLSLGLLRRMVTGRALHWFALYCALVGTAALVLALGGAR